MAELDTVQVPKDFWDTFKSLFTRREDDQPSEDIFTSEEYNSLVSERDDYKAKLEAIEQAELRQAAVDNFTAQLEETKTSADMAEILADLPAETAERIVQEFKALSAQIDESALLGEKGKEAKEALPNDPRAAFNAQVLAIQAEKGIPYEAAVKVAIAEHPDLYEAYAKA